MITDSNVARLFPNLLPEVRRFTFTAGESAKSRETWGALCDQLLAAGYGRDTILIALGGGVTTDLVGFVAATVMRGLKWVAVPTSTVAMLDAAVGGKTGLDTVAGKNLIGAFHPPSMVIADPEALNTLPDADFRNGLAEAIKHALIADRSLADWLGQNHRAIMAREPGALEHLISASLRVKAAVVSADERESGVRAILNAGHTIGHAIEHASKYQISHGEAVSIGLALETQLAETLGIAEPDTGRNVVNLLAGFGLPTSLSAEISWDETKAALRLDKKNRNAELHAALLRSVGAIAQPSPDRWTHPIPMSAVASILGFPTDTALNTLP
jgi:3-dehydroquinate synthase